MKALVGDRDDRILGFTMVGAAAGEVMAAVQTAMLAGLSYSNLADADFAHPTMAEGLSSLFSSVPPRVVRQTKPKGAERYPDPDDATAEPVSRSMSELGQQRRFDDVLAPNTDPSQPNERRDEMAKAAAPYVHPRLAAVDARMDLHMSHGDAATP